jgi:molybdopterin-binding protein
LHALEEHQWRRNIDCLPARSWIVRPINREIVMKISARNILKGKIVALKRGAVMAQVVLELAGGDRIASAIFVESVDDLGLKVGDEVAAVIKSTDVMIARP